MNSFEALNDFLASEDIERFVRFANMIEGMAVESPDFVILEMV